MSEPSDAGSGKILARLACRLLRAIGDLVQLLALSIFYYGVLTPLAVLLRLAGRDRLRLEPGPSLATYWVERPAAARQTDMTRQR
jgi:hypothetical protein